MVQAIPTWQSPHGRPLPSPGGRTLVMGILNVTPDSFSDGGELDTMSAVVERARRMVDAGADILDLGGESTRPGAAPVDTAGELARVIPALRALRRALPDVPLSIDTYKAAVARAAVAEGADLINDVWGAAHGISAEERARWTSAGRDRLTLPILPASPMAEAATELGCPLILMHNRPDRAYTAFVDDVLLDLRLSLTLARSAGVPKHQLWVDPGFGFAKSPEQNLEILRQLRLVAELGYPVLLGTSRKSTLGLVLGASVDQRLEATAATLVWGIQQGCSMVRVHDVADLARTVKVADAIRLGLAWKP